MEEITREKIRSTINAPKNIKEYVECRIAELLGLRCSPQYDCKACTKESMRRIINAWEKEVIDLKLENKNMCSRQDLAIEKTKRWKKDEELYRVKEKLENSIELPTDKNGKHIRMGNTVSKPLKDEIIVGIVDGLVFEMRTPKVHFIRTNSEDTYKVNADCVEVIGGQNEKRTYVHCRDCEYGKAPEIGCIMLEDKTGRAGRNSDGFCAWGVAK